MSLLTIGVLSPRWTGKRPAPGARPLERAATRLRSQGLRIVFGRLARGRFIGEAIEGMAWAPFDGAIHALYDRFPAASRPAEHARLIARVSVPYGNPLLLAALCRDKQRVYERLLSLPGAAALSMPDQVVARSVSERDLRGGACASHWFVKPRSGALGHGVQRVAPTWDAAWRAIDDAAAAGTGPADDWVVQVGVEAPAPWAGVSVRTHVAWDPEAGWFAGPSAARVHRTDPVVNRARGAEVLPASELVEASTLSSHRSALLDLTARLVASEPNNDPFGVPLELGWDSVLGADGRLHVIEVNGRPRGHAGVLAARWPDRFSDDSDRLVAAPIRALAAAARARS